MRTSITRPAGSVIGHRPLILAYHTVEPNSGWALSISENVFAEQLDFLARSGYVGLTFADMESRRTEGTLPQRSVSITFDDGFASVLNAKPLLDAVGYPATAFIVTRFVDAQQPLSWPGLTGTPEQRLPLSWNDAAQLSAAGWEIGSHTVTHPVLSNLTDVALEDELGRSREAIERRLGSCETIAYPYGWPDARVAAAAAQAGYAAGCTLTGAMLDDERYLRPRVGLGAGDRGIKLKLKLSTPGLAVRRTRVARARRRLRRKRDWMPV